MPAPCFAHGCSYKRVMLKREKRQSGGTKQHTLLRNAYSQCGTAGVDCARPHIVCMHARRSHCVIEESIEELIEELVEELVEASPPVHTTSHPAMLKNQGCGDACTSTGMHAYPQGCMHIHSHIPLYITMGYTQTTMTTMRHWQGALHAPSCSYCPECGSESIAVPLGASVSACAHNTRGQDISRSRSRDWQHTQGRRCSSACKQQASGHMYSSTGKASYSVGSIHPRGCGHVVRKCFG